MSKQYCNKRKYSKDDNNDLHPVKRLSDVDHITIERHINTVYVGTVVRLLGSYNNEKGKLDGQKRSISNLPLGTNIYLF